MDKHDYPVVQRRTLPSPSIQHDRPDPSLNVITLRNGTSIQLRSEDVTQLVNVAGDVVRAIKDIALARAATDNHVRILREEIGKMKEESSMRRAENDQRQQQWLEQHAEKFKHLQFCLNWLDANPQRSFDDLAKILEVLHP